MLRPRGSLARWVSFVSCTVAIAAGCGSGGAPGEPEPLGVATEALTGDEPDLVISSVSGPPSALPGGHFTTTVTVCNQGSSASYSTHVEVSLSADDVVTPSDPIAGSERTSIGGLVADTVAAGDARIKRITYPPGWRWSADMQPVVGTPSCVHAHVGFLAQGAIEIQYDDGCRQEFRAPAAVVIEPGHDGWVLGDETAIFIQVDCAGDTVDRFGLRAEHGH